MREIDTLWAYLFPFAFHLFPSPVITKSIVIEKQDSSVENKLQKAFGSASLSAGVSKKCAISIPPAVVLRWMLGLKVRKPVNVVANQGTAGHLLCWWRRIVLRTVSPGHILNAVCAFWTKKPPSSGGGALPLTHLLPFLLVKPLNIWLLFFVDKYCRLPEWRNGLFVRELCWIVPWQKYSSNKTSWYFLWNAHKPKITFYSIDFNCSFFLSRGWEHANPLEICVVPVKQQGFTVVSLSLAKVCNVYIHRWNG